MDSSVELVRKTGRVVTALCCFVMVVVLISPMNARGQSRGISMEDVVVKSGLSYEGGTYRALIIGNNDYQVKNSWKPLKTAVAGAKALYDLLQDQYGFSDVNLLENATRRDILLALQSLSKRVEANDSVVVYYAGHGYLNIDTQKGYWVPVDARNTDHTTFLRNSTIRDELGIIASRVKHTLLISDSCFSGTLLRSATRGISTATGTQTYYRKMANRKSIQILTAGGIEYVDDDYSASGHSPFTYFLINELKNNPRPLITASELSTSVEKAVGNNVDQVPQSGVLQGVGDELGEFIFINIDVAVKGVPKDKVKVNVNVVEAPQEQPPSAVSDTSLRLGVELIGSSWTGSNRNSDTDFDDGGAMLGLNLHFQKRRFFTGLELRGGEYRFNDDTPDQISGNNTESFRDVEIGHTELDLDVGYHFWKHISLFLTYRTMTNEWSNNDYEMRFGGLGVGVAGQWPIAKRWDLHGSFSLVPNATVDGDVDNIGDASAGELEFGAAYTRNKHRFGFGLRLNTVTYDFDIGDKQEHTNLGLYGNYAYRFDF